MAARPGDLRSDAKDRQRVKNHNAKWAHGFQPAVGKKCESDPFGYIGPCNDCAKRPATSRGWVDSCYYEKTKAQQHSRAVRGFYNDIEDGRDYNSDRSDDVNIIPEPDTDVTYSFDAQRGPGQGSQILSYAILQAVERYENKETEKIVKEYDLVADNEDEVEFADAEDDFELVDAAHMK